MDAERKNKMSFVELSADAQSRAIEWFICEFDMWGECGSKADVVYSLHHGGFTFNEDGSAIEC